MVKVDVTINNERGFHAITASEFTATASKFNSEIKVIKDNVAYDGNAVLQLLGMVSAKGDKLTIVAQGLDEEKATRELKKLVELDFVNM